MRTLRPDVSAEMAAVVEACLAWEPDRRPESAAVVLHLLESVGVQPTPDSAHAIAKSITSERVRRGRRLPRLAVAAAVVVVAAAALIARPFIVSNGTRGGYRRLAVLYPELPAETRDRDAVAARLHHMLTATLTPVSGLRLVGQSSVKPWKERGLSAGQIADSLRGIGAEDVLALRISSSDGANMLALELQSGAGTSNETIAGPFPVGALDQLPPDSLRGFVRMLAVQSLRKLRLGSDNRTVSETQLIEAYMAWLSGRDARDRRTPNGLRQAIGYFERAISLDSAYAGARADLAQTMTLALVYHYRMPWSPYELATRALQEADRAVALKPDLADGYLALGLLGVTAGAPFDFSKRAYDEAGKLNSANPDARTWQIGLLGRQLKFEEAAQRAEEEVQHEPASAGKRTASAIYSLAARDPATAIRNAAEAPASRTGVWIVSQVELWGRLLLNSAASECAAVPAGPYLGARALCLERIGRAPEGRALNDSLVRIVTGKAARDSTFDLALPYGELALYAARHDERDETLQWLRSAFKESPAGIDYRLMQAGMFAPWAVAYADSLQRAGWNRVIAAARPD